MSNVGAVLDQEVAREVPISRIPALDGLRGLAILLVLLWHCLFAEFTPIALIRKLLFVGKLSWSGVDLFFVLSGFLIGGILLDARSSPRYFQTFYLRRAFRILPLYFLVLSLYVGCYLSIPNFSNWLASTRCTTESRHPEILKQEK